MTTLLATLVLSLPQMPVEALDAWAAPAGLQIVRMHMTEGDVVVYLPARISAGDTVSGAVYLEPAGEARADVAKNNDLLSKYSMDVMGSTLLITNSQFSTQAPEDGSPIVIVLRGEDGGTAQRATAQVGAGGGLAADEIAACPVVEYGTAIRVVGKFDGKRETTMAWIDDMPAGVLAEGSRDCVVSTMNAGVGPHKLRIKEGGIETEQMVNVASVTIKAPMDARIGRKTAIEVTVDGLEGAPESAYPLKVVLANSMPKLFPFGDSTELTVDSAGVSAGRWTGKVEFKPKGKGQFALTARLICDGFMRRLGQ